MAINKFEHVVAQKSVRYCYGTVCSYYIFVLFLKSFWTWANQIGIIFKQINLISELEWTWE